MYCDFSCTCYQVVQASTFFYFLHVVPSLYLDNQKYKNSIIALKSSLLRDVNCGRETKLAWDFETCLFLLTCLSDTELVSLSLLDLPSPTLSDRSPRANWGEDFKLFPNSWSLYPDKARVSLAHIAMENIITMVGWGVESEAIKWAICLHSDKSKNSYLDSYSYLCVRMEKRHGVVKRER